MKRALVKANVGFYSLCYRRTGPPFLRRRSFFPERLPDNLCHRGPCIRDAKSRIGLPINGKEIGEIWKTVYS